MSQLEHLRDQIENGRTAKWQFTSERSDRFYFIIKIKKVEGGAFAWQHKMLQARSHQLVSTQTVLHPSFDALYEDIKGDGSETDQTLTYGWKITDEPLDPYLPERKTAPDPPDMSLFALRRDLEE